MKKWLAGLGILGLSVLTLAACGNKSDNKASGEKQTITVATDSDTAPFTFKKGDDFKGYDIDLVFLWPAVPMKRRISTEWLCPDNNCSS